MPRPELRFRRAGALVALAALSVYSSLRQHPVEWGLEPSSSAPFNSGYLVDPAQFALPAEDSPVGLVIVVNEQGEAVAVFRLQRSNSLHTADWRLDLASVR